MGFGGSVSAMIASLKANKRSRVSTFDKIKDFKKTTKSELFFQKKATKKDLKKVREKIKQQNKIRFYKNIIVIIIFLMFAIYLISISEN